MITKEQLLYIFWPWGEVKRLRKAVAKYMVESANVMVQLDKVGEQIKTLKGQQEMGTKLAPNLFARIEELREQLRQSEQENEQLNATILHLRQQLQQARNGEELPPLTSGSHDQ